MRLVVIYGPPGSGKLTVAQKLAELTGYKVFHNHLTVNAVRALFEFGTPDFSRVLWQVRSGLIAEAARLDVNTILTLSPARGPEFTFPERLKQIEGVVGEHGGEVIYVHLEPSPEILTERVIDPSREAYDKLMDPERLKQILEEWGSQPLHESHLSIDNSFLPPTDVAKSIAGHYRLPLAE